MREHEERLGRLVFVIRPDYTIFRPLSLSLSRSLVRTYVLVGPPPRSLQLVLLLPSFRSHRGSTFSPVVSPLFLFHFFPG